MSWPAKENHAPPAPPVEAPPVEGAKPRRKLGFKAKIGLTAVIQRKQFSDRVDYKAISARTGCSKLYLRQLWVAWKRGEIDLGEPDTPEERTIDAQALEARKRELMRRYEHALLCDFEAALLKTEDDQTRKIKLAWEKNGLPQLVTELRKVVALRASIEQDNKRLLDDIATVIQREKALMSPAAGTVNEIRVLGQSMQQRALAALEVEAEAVGVEAQDES